MINESINIPRFIFTGFFPFILNFEYGTFFPDADDFPVRIPFFIFYPLTFRVSFSDKALPKIPTRASIPTSAADEEIVEPQAPFFVSRRPLPVPFADSHCANRVKPPDTTESKIICRAVCEIPAFENVTVLRWCGRRGQFPALLLSHDHGFDVASSVRIERHFVTSQPVISFLSADGNLRGIHRRVKRFFFTVQTR